MHDNLALGSKAPAPCATGISMKELQSDLRQWHRAKADVYRLLSACYYEPEEAFLEENVFGQLEQALSALDSERAVDAKSMGAYFLESSAEDLRIDYTRLFLGPFGIRSKPYGSVYLDGKNIVMGESTMALLTLYHDGGFHVAENFSEMPDHVAVELEFLYLLNTRLAEIPVEVTERDRLSRLGRSLLAEHLGQWIIPFTEAMKKGADTDFYRKLADLTQSFILDELREPHSDPIP